MLTEYQRSERRFPGPTPGKRVLVKCEVLLYFSDFATYRALFPAPERGQLSIEWLERKDARRGGSI